MSVPRSNEEAAQRAAEAIAEWAGGKHPDQYMEPAQGVLKTIDFERVCAERDASMAVSSTSFRDAIAGPLATTGGPSLAELAGFDVKPDTPNFVIQDAIADRLMELRALEALEDG